MGMVSNAALGVTAKTMVMAGGSGGDVSNLKTTYDKFFGSFWTNGIGQFLKTVMALVAIVLAAMLILALIMKAMGKQNQLVMQYSNGKTIFFTILFILILLAPTLLGPALGVVDKLIDFLNTDSNKLLGS
ncbi:hypothetical protein [Pseudoscardovia suis]|uniref:Uncharacterized protein n=1 Tax=Pseudoscardovia suis TaxID=987063 RepID=A0A261EPQ1_9BIFI|nr:hypothetical protein [Pseudoscardovia suis]OZG48832.1 hypothetical protein PSSU_1656 [Pseudoscardovia suis]PJJ63976.1 hypothetical protein CLV65_1600 [Pseudoscardovia suis]